MTARQQRMALPDDMLIEITQHIAATSPHPIDDICSLRPSCHDMRMACSLGAVGKHVALEREEFMRWSDEQLYRTLVDNLTAVGSPEACFIVGLTHVFANRFMQLGTQHLRQAADVGHKEAAYNYVLGILHYSFSEMQEAKNIRQVEGEGVVALGCKKARGISNRGCVRCRAHTVETIDYVTWKVASTMVPVPAPLPVEEDGQGCSGNGCGKPEEWGSDYAIFCSEGCRIRHEYTKFFGRVSFPVN